ncbi:SHQ1 protein-domain-containing protein [Pholiota molesta]|nr:SHQ1 protein-domain-containing protein [Pholiota molesta]
MITPRFSCSQTENAVVISMYYLVTVHVNPYFLRLNFSKPLLEDEESSANYDPSSAMLTVTLTKENKGEVFEDLDLLAKLLAPRKLSTKQLQTRAEEDLVAQTESLSMQDGELVQGVLTRDSEENDWQLPQEVPQEGLPPLNLSKQMHYGFLDMHSGYLKHALHTENEINELGGDAEECTKEERTARRIKHENDKFDEEHYMADFMDDEYIQELIAWTHPHISDQNPFQYTDKENMAMLVYPGKNVHLATEVQTHDLYLTLVTLLFSYAYDSRTSQHDPTPESAWTMGNLTPAFTALDPPQLQDALVPSYRRSLTFPLYRSFALAEKCRKDVACLLQKGKRTIMSKIWLDDFCVWIQADADDEILKHLGKGLMDVKVDKDLIDWDLDIIEKAALQAVDRETDSDDESTDSDA